MWVARISILVWFFICHSAVRTPHFLPVSLSLNYKYYGGEGKPPLIILHGLLGSSRNWNVAGKELTEAFEVFALDARNHGGSPHTLTHTYEDMMEDVLHWMDQREMHQAALLGHSMGGKVAMLTACRNWDRVSELYVADISPKDYQPHYDHYLRTMLHIDLSRLETRDAAEAEFERVEEQWAMRKFLMTNLVRDPETNAFRWQVNPEILLQDYDEIVANPLLPEDHYRGPCIFIRGGQSTFIEDTDRELIQTHFPQANLITIKDAGHNIHVDARQAFVQTVLRVRRHHSGSG
jgi:esterase